MWVNFTDLHRVFTLLQIFALMLLLDDETPEKIDVIQTILGSFEFHLASITHMKGMKTLILFYID